MTIKAIKSLPAVARRDKRESDPILTWPTLALGLDCARGDRGWPSAMTFRKLIRPRLRRSSNALSSPTSSRATRSWSSACYASRSQWPPAILNTGNSFDLKTIEGGQMAMEGLHGFKNKDIEKVSYRSPEFYLCA